MNQNSTDCLLSSLEPAYSNINNRFTTPSYLIKHSFSICTYYSGWYHAWFHLYRFRRAVSLPIGPKKNWVEYVLDLASCQLSFNSVNRFQRRNRKCIGQSVAGAVILSYQLAPQKNTNWVEDVEILLPVKFRWTSVQPYSEKSKISQPIRGRGGHLIFSDPPKNTNLVEDDKILLPVEFRWIPLCGFRGEVENISANQRPGRQSCFSDRPEKHKLIRRRWDLASYQVSFNFNQRRSRKCLNLSEAERPSCFFRSARKTKNLVAFGSGALKSVNSNIF